MEELCLQLTKYQYHDFMMLLQSLEYISRASQFRKYKSRHGLENLPNYNGRIKDLWKFAFDCVYEEEVMRQINNWSWDYMKKHITTCKAYRQLYKVKLTSSKKLTEDIKNQIRKFEEILDEVNIRIQRQLAENEIDKVEREKEAEKQDKKSSSGTYYKLKI
jgi:vacuolar protein sorting-associated protein 13A/C